MTQISCQLTDLFLNCCCIWWCQPV